MKNKLKNNKLSVKQFNALNERELSKVLGGALIAATNSKFYIKSRCFSGMGTTTVCVSSC